MDKDFDKAGAARQAARWRRNHHWALYVANALAALPRFPAQALLRRLWRQRGMSAGERAQLTSLSPRARYLFDELQTAIDALGKPDGPGGPQSRY